MASITTYLRTLPAAPVAGAVAQALDAVLAWHERAVSRRRLAEMDDRMLADMGITRSAADVEARKAFWQA